MSQDLPTRARILVSGRVQGVAYRAFTRRTAVECGLRGGVRNLRDGRVEVEVEGEKRMIEAFLESLWIGPPMAQVNDLELRWESPNGRCAGFDIWFD